MRSLTPFSLLLFLVLILLLPILFGELMAESLEKLHLSPGAAGTLTLVIIAGGFINIPVKRIEHQYQVPVHPLTLFGLDGMMPRMQRMQQETVIAVNLGGCVIPSALALYELLHIAALGLSALGATLVAAAINIAICKAIARPVAGVGILLPGLVPALTAATAALILMPHDAAPVAFVAGVAGPLVGADLLHLKDIAATPTGIASIGGAGTFDGIVLSGIVAAYLA